MSCAVTGWMAEKILRVRPRFEALYVAVRNELPRYHEIAPGWIGKEVLGDLGRCEGWREVFWKVSSTQQIILQVHCSS